MDGGEARGGPGKRAEASDEERGNRQRIPPDAPEPDVLDQTREWQEDAEVGGARVPIDAPEADVLDDWHGEDKKRPSRVPIDAPEADVLDQARPADLDDEDREHD
jgi:hypothetical protein